MAISVVSAGAKENLSTAATAVTAGVTTTTGSTFVVFITTTGTAFAATAVTDSKGNTWTQIQSGFQAGFGVYGELWRCENGTGGTSHTFTVHGSGSGNLLSIIAVEVKGAATASFDQSAAAFDDSASPFTSNATGVTSQANEAVLAFMFDNRSGNSTPSWGNSFTALDNLNNNAAVTCSNAYKIVSATGVQQSSFVDASITEAISFIATFKEAGGGTPPTVTDVNTTEIVTSTQTGVVVTGTVFGASQGSSTIGFLQGSTTVNQTVTSWANTSITISVAFDFTAPTSSLKYGAATCIVTVSGNNGTLGITITPPDARSYVDLTSVSTSSAYRITATGGLVAGDQIEVVSVSGGSISDVTLNPDATWDAASGVTSFDIRVWDSMDATWGPTATQFTTPRAAIGDLIDSAWAVRRRTMCTSNALGLIRKHLDNNSVDQLQPTVWDDWFGLLYSTVVSTLSASFSAAPIQSATLTAGISLAASLRNQTQLSGSLLLSASLSAAIINNPMFAAPLTANITLSAAVTPAASFTAAVSTGIALAAGLNGQASVNATLTTSTTMSAAFYAAALQSATIVSPAAMAAAFYGSSLTTAALTTSISAVAAFENKTLHTAALTTGIPFAASFQEPSQFAAGLVTFPGGYVASFYAQPTITAQLSTSIVMAGSFTSTATITAGLVLAPIFATAMQTAALFNAAVTTGIALTSTFSANEAFAAGLVTSTALTVQLTARNVFTAGIDVTPATSLAAALTNNPKMSAALTTQTLVRVALAAQPRISALFVTPNPADFGASPNALFVHLPGDPIEVHLPVKFAAEAYVIGIDLSALLPTGVLLTSLTTIVTQAGAGTPTLVLNGNPVIDTSGTIALVPIRGGDPTLWYSVEVRGHTNNARISPAVRLHIPVV